MKIIKRKYFILSLAIVLLLAISASSVSFAKWGGASLTASSGAMTDSFYVPVVGADVDENPQLVRRLYFKNGKTLKNYICISNTDGIGGVLYFEINEADKNPDIADFTVKQAMTDSAGVITPSGANNNITSDLPDNMKNISLSALSGAGNSAIHVKFAEGASSYVALDFTLEVKNAVTCTVDVYFKASKNAEFTGDNGAVIYDQDGNILGQVEETTGMSLLIEAVNEKGIIIGFIYYLTNRGDLVGKTKIQITEGYSYTLYCESEPVTETPVGWDNNLMTYDPAMQRFVAKKTTTVLVDINKVDGRINGTVEETNK